MTLMGVNSLDPKNLRGYPHGITAPTDVTGKKLLWFDWKYNEKHDINAEGIRKVLEHVRSNGAECHPPATSALLDILDIHLKAKITQRFKYISKKYTEKKREEEEVEARAEAAAEREAEDGEESVIEDVQSKRITAKMRSRVGAVSSFNPSIKTK